jgi:hypothetical protein
MASNAAAVPSYDSIPTIDRDDDAEGEARAATMNFVGPVASRFVQDKMFLSGIMGPYGSAKTTSCFQKIIWITMWQKPGKDGVRRSRGCVIRETYAQLKANVMDDFFSWFPKTKDNFNGDDMVSKLKLDIPGYGKLEIEILWRALGEENKPEKVFKGMQLTWLWLNEGDTLHRAVLKFGLPRVGRYPKAKDGGCAWSGIFLDMNAPDVDNWTYELLVEKNLGLSEKQLDEFRKLYGANFGVAFHRQPGARDPNAENLANLPPGYYDRLMIGANDNDVRRFVDNEFGAVRNGQPVFPEFIDAFHTAVSELRAAEGIELCMAIDGGATPAAVFGQKMPTGQIRIVDELVIFNDDDDKQLQSMGPTAFGKACREFVNERFPNARINVAWSDPATDYEGTELDPSWLDDFSLAFGMKVKPAPVKGNRLKGPQGRLEIVRDLLVNNVAGRPGMIISPACRYLRRGFNNGYVITRVSRSNGTGLWKDEPLKNDFSHVQDALQYLVAGLNKRGSVLDDMDRKAAAKKVATNVKHTGFAGARR